MSFCFETARDVSDIGECAFYHYMDLPGVGRVGDHWDLRRTIDDYFGLFRAFRLQAKESAGRRRGEWLSVVRDGEARRGRGVVRSPRWRVAAPTGPFRALQSASRLSTEWVVITQQCLQHTEPGRCGCSSRIRRPGPTRSRGG